MTDRKIIKNHLLSGYVVHKSECCETRVLSMGVSLEILNINKFMLRNNSVTISFFKHTPTGLLESINASSTLSSNLSHTAGNSNQHGLR